ncbi:MAG: hypothetical protein M1482_16870, partial [Chloroflexi bacterium]|nr:hypothetical protein [Chloroflexota bacterium]
MGLRLAEGVTFQRFAERFGRSMGEIYHEEIAELDTLGLLSVTNEGVALSPRGRLLGNEVFARFLSPAIP